MSKCHIIQDSKDGLGHQLYGLFSLLILHNCDNYFFDGNAYINKDFDFDHINGKEKVMVKKYIVRCIKKFIENNGQTHVNYTNKIHSHEIYKIPIKYSSDTLYTLDNAYYFERVNLTGNGNLTRSKNILKFKEYFNIGLERNVKTTVVHIRLGDSVDRAGNSNFRKTLKELLELLSERYPDNKIIIHSDGKPDFIDYEYYDNKTPVLKVLEDLINADVLVCCVSALSLFASFINNGSLILVPDDTKQSVPRNSIRIKDYINKMSLVKLGTNYGGWYVPKNLKLDENSIVYSGGVGEDISFDLLLSDKYNCCIKLIDPTERSEKHFREIKCYYNKEITIKDFSGDIQKDYNKVIRRLKPNFDKFEFLEVGLWDKEDELKFFKPENPKYVSHTLIEDMYSKDYVSVKVKSVKDVMLWCGHDHIDLIKLDIEGAEVKTINQMLDDSIFPTYILVEFDLLLRGGDKSSETEKVITRIKDNYILLKNDSYNMTFVKK